VIVLVTPLVPHLWGFSPDATPRSRGCIRGSHGALAPVRATLCDHIWAENALANWELSGPVDQFCRVVFAMAVAMPDSTSSTVTFRALAKILSACLAGSRRKRPDSHLT
jgi:hypothetical protein